MRLKLTVVAAFLAISTCTASAQSPVGDWLVEGGGARIRIVECEGALWGLMAAEVEPGTDSNNPDPKLRGRPMLGVPMLLNLKQSEPNLWKGKIYDPLGTRFTAGGKYYDVKVGLGSKGKLEVRGCIGAVFCGGQDWTRVTDPGTPPVPPAGSIFAPKTGAVDAKSSKAPAKGAAPQAAADPVCASVAGVKVPN